MRAPGTHRRPGVCSLVRGSRARYGSRVSDAPNESSPPGSRAPASVYAGFLDALNRRDLDDAARWVDLERYRENCLGFTRGFVGWAEAVVSLRTVWTGLPDLRVDLDATAVTGDTVLAHGTVRGTNTGRLYGTPATRRGFEASFFDTVHVQDGLIVERVQQTDVLSQMRQIYGRALGTVATGALLWRLPGRPG